MKRDGRDRPSVAATLYSCDDADLSTVDLFLAGPAPAPLVVLLPRTSTVNYRRTLHAGAAAVLSLYAELPDIVQAVEGAIGGLITIPQFAAEAVTENGRKSDPLSALSDQEVSWLDRLARGCTIAKLAGESGYSERAMYRRLSLMYRRLGVDGRTGALLYAMRSGLLK